ncbi:hypothetical protein HDU89_005013 [Geranomyces variabilis]|nr:hypothetical protein HDU89_005013 [Geranomyces variabilis]
MWSSALAITIAITTILLIASVATPKWVTVSDFMPNSAFAIQYGLLRSCLAQPWVTVCSTYESIGGSQHEDTRTTAADMMKWKRQTIRKPAGTFTLKLPVSHSILLSPVLNKALLF